MNAFFARNVLLILAAGLVLGACGGDMDDLDQYINEIKARPGGRIDTRDQWRGRRRLLRL